MSQCPCGNGTTTHRARHKAARLSWQYCGACKRCGCWRLRIGGVLVARDEPARRAFNALEADPQSRAAERRADLLQTRISVSNALDLGSGSPARVFSPYPRNGILPRRL
jgi:hypothetical protein